MDTYRAWDDNAEYDLAHEDEPAIEAPPEIGVDERRMHVRAYNYWVSLLDGRPYPSIQDVDPETLDDFGPHSVLLDFTQSTEDPAVRFIGRTLREECGLDYSIKTIADVPSRSLLSRLTDHYLQIIANCAPIGFEAEFLSSKGLNTMYRGILMPLSSDGEAIDFIYGVINWKEVADRATVHGIAGEANRAAAKAPLVEASPIWADGPLSEAPLRPALAFDEPLGDGLDEQPALSIDPDAGLADRLCLARESADAVKNADLRSRSALYRALGQAYDFALAAEAAPADYAEILEDAGLTAQDRAPMTPIVKLIFGVDYDKTRLTEFAAALSYGRREGVAQGGLTPFLEGFGGGLKAIVAAERRARRPEAKPEPADPRDALRRARPLCRIELDGDDEFVLLVARREPDGSVSVIAPVAADAGLLDRALRKARA
jgi:hypothetical protein